MDKPTGMIEIEGFKRVNGLLWPEMDTECAAVVFGSVKDIEHALQYVKRRNTVVQAGGNCGVWALALAEIFRDVYTIEPDQDNFTALAVNTAKSPNIVKLHAAIGDTPALVGTTLVDRANCGSKRVNFTGMVPTLRIDDLGLRELDLLCLDIEGRELAALKGANFTIRKYRPIIMFEDKGLSSHYGIQKGMAEKWLEQTHNYRVAGRIARDVICAPFEVLYPEGEDMQRGAALLGRREGAAYKL